MQGNKPEGVATKPYIVSIDMGSPKRGSFGWCDNRNYDDRNHKGDDVDELLILLLKENYFAMGIEAPLFIPVRPNTLKDFTAKRDFESNHPWSAGAGACVTAISLGFLGSLLARIRKENPDIMVTTDIEVWKKCRENCILIWESFIVDAPGQSSKADDPDSHTKDAGEALRLFEMRLFANQESNAFQTLSPGTYLDLPLAIAKEVGMRTFSSGIVIVKGEKQPPAVQ